MAFLPKRLQSKFDSKLYDSKPQLNPTEALDAIERLVYDIAYKRSVGSDDYQKAVLRAEEALTHLATIKQQVAELVAFREAHEWERPLPSEALYSFAGWLTGRNEAVTFSANHESGIAAELVNAFCKANDFDSPRDGIWPGNVKHPPAADGGHPHDH